MSADAARELERAAAARRVHAMRMAGGIQSASEGIDRAMRDAPGAKAFIGGDGIDREGFTVVAESEHNPGFWHYLQIGVGEAVTSKRPIHVDALPVALASLGAFAAKVFEPIDHAGALHAFFKGAQS